VAGCRVVVKEILQRDTAETGADERRDHCGDRPARQHDDAGHGQRRDVFDLVAEPGPQDLLWAADVLGDGERIVRGQHREIGPLEPAGEQRCHGIAEMLAVGKRADRLADDREYRRCFGHADPLLPARAPSYATVKHPMRPLPSSAS
jgi:hypothetical protein